MAKKDPVQGLSPDPRDKYEEEASARRLGKIRDVAGAIALPVGLYAMGSSALKEDKARSAENRAKEKAKGLTAAERKELMKEEVAPPRGTTKKEADTFREGMKPPKDSEMKKGGSVKSASSRADGCAIRGKTRA
jgi:hypothetical protein